MLCIYISYWPISYIFFRCDAEPIALAKYVCALLKKNKPEQDLKDICVDQLDVFLQQSMSMTCEMMNSFCGQFSA